MSSVVSGSAGRGPAGSAPAWPRPSATAAVAQTNVGISAAARRRARVNRAAAWSTAPSCASNRAARASRRGSSGTARAALSASARACSSVSRPAPALGPREQAGRFDRGRPPGPGADRSAAGRRVAVARGQLDLVRQKLGARIARRIGDRARERLARPADVAEVEQNLGSRHPGSEKRRSDDARRLEGPRGPLEIATQGARPAERVERIGAPGLGGGRGRGDARGPLAVAVSGGQQRLGARGHREGPSDRPSGSPKRERISSASGAVGTP